MQHVLQTNNDGDLKHFREVQRAELRSTSINRFRLMFIGVVALLHFQTGDRVC